ncbi:hypothetical protein [Aureibacter tunicatorum]|uniref:Uncharacterized protein n=1 Tax=Aureibacter tunicatorum TaxID=866807 RepID=A0AAE4BR88_9BACT|nr:hypothetical protein [Aureibacter tunicatorum]MDR6239964.1 hypothetical protein [Aureibacter tunicatorum]
MKELSQKIMNFEHWISSGLKSKCPDNIPLELLMLFKESGDAYAFYRNYLFRVHFISNNDINLINEFFDFINSCDVFSDFKKLIEFYSINKQVDLFNDKRENVFEIAMEKPKDGLSQNACFLYQSYYEIETLLLIFVSIVKLKTKNRLDLELYNFKDRKGRLKKGNCIDYIKPKLKDYPILQAVFSSAYNIQLRNTIGHNDYRIIDNTIQSYDGKSIIDKDDFFKSLYDIQHLNNLLINYFSSKNIGESLLFNCGVLSMGYGIVNGNVVLVIYQLECFFDLDISKDWLNKVYILITKSDFKIDVNAKTKLTRPVNQLFEIWLCELTKESKLKVIVQSIRPKIKESSQVINIECGDFEILSNKLEKNVEYEISDVD